MIKLIKPRKQSYTGEDARVVAYSLACEITSATQYCVALAGLGFFFGGPPALGAVAGTCAIVYVFSSAACYGYI